MEQIKAVKGVANSPKFGAIKSKQVDMRPTACAPDRREQSHDVRRAAIVKPYMRELVREIGAVLSSAQPPDARGHTTPKWRRTAGPGSGNWELSATARMRRPRADRRQRRRPHLRVRGRSSVPFEREDPLKTKPAHQHHRDEPRRQADFRKKPATPCHDRTQGARKHRTSRQL